MLEIKTEMLIWENNQTESNCLVKQWVSVESLLEEIDNARDKGNLIGEKGFSAALFLSNLIKKLEKSKHRVKQQ